jgi:hypothetical protein
MSVVLASPSMVKIGHVVAQVVAGLHYIQAFELAVFAGRHAKGGAGNFGGEYRILFARGHAAGFPLVGQLPAYGDGAQPLLDPYLRITFGLVKLAGTGAGQFGVFYFFDSLVTTCASQRLKGSALGEGMDWMMRNRPSVLAQFTRCVPPVVGTRRGVAICPHPWGLRC